MRQAPSRRSTAFRDSTWATHVPRRLQELRVTLAKAKEELAARLDREVTVAELAPHLKLSEEEVIEGLIASSGYTAGLLDLSVGSEQNSAGTVTYGDIKGDDDPPWNWAKASRPWQLSSGGGLIAADRLGRPLWREGTTLS